VEEIEGGKARETRIAHEPGMLKGFLGHFDEGSPVAVETVGNWYWTRISQMKFSFGYNKTSFGHISKGFS